MELWWFVAYLFARMLDRELENTPSSPDARSYTL